MTEGEAMSHVCAVACATLESLIDSGTSEFFEQLDSCDLLPDEDQEQVAKAVRLLISELGGRGA